MEGLVRYCLQCREALDLNKGRRDRLFCDAGCRNKYHNTRTWEEGQEIKRIQLILKKNRRILKKMFARRDRDSINRDLLLQQGFDFLYHTHLVTTVHKSNEYVFCFDYGYRPLEGNRYKIIEAFRNS